MHFTTLLPLALTANAFLVPPQISEKVAIIETLPSNADREIIKLECDRCPIAVESGKTNVRGSAFGFFKASQNRASFTSSLEADVKVQDGKVLFNGQQIWPDGMNLPLSIKQSTEEKNIPEYFKGLIPISASIDFEEPEVLVSDKDHITIHPVSIEILALADQVVHAETVEIRIAETIHGIGLLPSRIRAYESSPLIDQCQTVWCRVKGTVAKKFQEWTQAAAKKVNNWRGGCPGRKGSPTPLNSGLRLKGGPNKFGPGSTLGKHLHDQDGKPNHGKHEHHHGHHRHGLRHFFRMFIRTVLLPAFFSLSAGVIIGAFTWLIVTEVRRIRAARRGDYIVVEQVEEGRASFDGLPPKYEEVYREASPETENEKKELLQ